MTATAEKLDLDHLRQWIGRSTEASDIVTAQLVKGLRATLFQEIGEPKDGDAAPWTTHWCLAQPVFPMSMLGADGESPPTSRISDVPLKTGSPGALCFVSVDHRVTTPRGVAIRERQDIVY